MQFLVVGLGGFMGAIFRYLFYIAERSLPIHIFPFGTLAINTLGCFLSGLLIATVEKFTIINQNLILIASMGFIGSFTTFSTFSVESFHLIRNNQAPLAILNMTANLFLGLCAIWVGRTIWH